MVATPYELFVELVRCTFLGGKQVINGTEYTLEPTILRKQDLAGEDPKFGGKTQVSKLFSNLPEDFKDATKSEMYGKKAGWIDRGPLFRQGFARIRANSDCRHSVRCTQAPDHREEEHPDAVGVSQQAKDQD